MIQQHHAQSAAAAAMAAAAAAAAAAQGTAPGAHPVFDLAKFWQEQLNVAESFESDFKNHPLPLARIKKVMKTDQDVKAPILFAKGCEIFITELTKRAWVHAEENKRRTLQRSDIATAISKTDMCDFLIDIVPREEAAKSSSAVYDQNAYQYYQSANVPQYTSAQQIDPAAYYPQLSQLTPEQMQQYQLQLQQFAAQQHPYAQQMQSRQNAPGQSAPGSSAQPGQPSNSDATKSESQQQ
ncbi:histone-fold-containing protein [Lichtheimia hyalospora FSU 10163]|nr:histone-fold-containing protein [Lichtheimia hyalospora FSU 10163]